jgi:hypothetical protein
MTSLPLHVTILTIFFSEEQPPFFASILQRVAMETRSFSTQTTGRALYGVDEDIPVTLVQMTTELGELHQTLLDEVSGSVSFLAPQFVGENFGPHVTDQSEHSIPVGTTFPVDNLMLVEIIDQNVFVRSFHSLGAAI